MNPLSFTRPLRFGHIVSTPPIYTEALQDPVSENLYTIDLRPVATIIPVKETLTINYMSAGFSAAVRLRGHRCLLRCPGGLRERGHLQTFLHKLLCNDYIYTTELQIFRHYTLFFFKYKQAQ